MRQVGVSRVLVGTLAVPLLAGGCDIFGGHAVHTVINAAHHGMRAEDGAIPEYGEPTKPRVFLNDTGWTVSLSEGFVVTTSAQLERCDGTPVDLGTPFGPFPEYWSDLDKNVTDFAIVELEEGEYCKLIVEYGRYLGQTAQMAEDTPFPVEDAAQLEGNTLYLAGYAERPDGNGGTVTYNFGLRTSQTIRVELDMSKLGKDGAPWRITGDEVGTLNLTVAKTYDSFFQGIDFDALDVAAVEARLPQLLADNTTLIAGTSIY